MLDSLITWITSVLADALPFYIVRQYEQGLQLRAGKFIRLIDAGFWWKVPFYDDILTQHIAVTTMQIPAQSLVTTDNKSIVVTSVVKYKIADIKTFLMDVYDSVDAISDVAQGIIKNIIMTSTWEECRHEEIDNAITKKVRAALKKFGVEVDTVILTSISEMRTYRLINQSQTIFSD